MKKTWDECTAAKNPATRRQRIVMYDCVEWGSPGILALGLSSLTGRYWGGGVLFFNWNDGESLGAQQVVNFATCDSSVADIKLLSDSQRALIALDTGALLLLSVPPVSVSQNFDGCISGTSLRP